MSEKSIDEIVNEIGARHAAELVGMGLPIETAVAILDATEAVIDAVKNLSYAHTGIVLRHMQDFYAAYPDPTKNAGRN